VCVTQSVTAVCCRTLSHCDLLCHSAVACFTGIMDPNASQVRQSFIYLPSQR